MIEEGYEALNYKKSKFPVYISQSVNQLISISNFNINYLLFVI